MLNEKVERTEGELSIIKNNLILNEKISVNNILYFENSSKKRYLVKQVIEFGDYIIENPVEINYLKIYFKRFLYNKHIVKDKIGFLKLVTKTIKINNMNIQERHLKYLGKEIEVFLDEVDIEVFLKGLSDQLIGYSLIKLYQKQEIFSANPAFCKFGTDMITDPNNQVYLRNSHLLEDIKEVALSGEYDKDKIEEFLISRKK